MLAARCGSATVVVVIGWLVGVTRGRASEGLGAGLADRLGMGDSVGDDVDVCDDWLLFPVWLATAVAACWVWARSAAGSGRYPTGSCPGWSPGVWPAPAAKSRKRAIAAALACEVPAVGTAA